MIKNYKRIIYCLFAIAFTSALADTLSNSAPASSSGAPGEADCTTSGCHESFALNSGQGAATIIIENGATSYIPSKTYTIVAETTFPNLNRFGFQLVAIKDKDSSNVGTLNCTEQSRTQIIKGDNKLASRNYMTYTFDGSTALSKGSNKWQFNWTAPSSDEGKITFYLATIAADDNGSDLGDYCYTKSLSLNSSPLALNNEIENNFKLDVYPNPTKGKIAISYEIEKPSTVQIELYDLQGNKLQQLSSKATYGRQSTELDFMKEYEAGIYFIKLNTGNKSAFKKIIIFN